MRSVADHEMQVRTKRLGPVSRRGVIALAMLAALTLTAAAAHAAGDWNDSKIQWQPYDEGLAAAKKASKPICLVMYTEWCPHCTNYSGVFHDPKVVEQSKQFVMIRVDKDKNPDVSKKYAPDGEYIPRTYFLSPDGQLDAAIHAPREQYRYFYDEKMPGSILAGMDAALKKHGSKEKPTGGGGVKPQSPAEDDRARL